ncbi:dynein light chain Tctex-type protein 2B isoform X2 [Halyomorpha halys]|nr:tctex1 domain-containing protein 2-like [Halyomorpha halys]
MATHKQMSRVSGEATKKTSLIQELIKSNAEQEANSKKKMELFKSAGFEMRPDLSKKFRSLSIQNIINKVLNDNLYGQTYSSDTAEELTKSLATTIRQKLEGEVYERYKLIVNVVLGERRGGGVKVGARCLWDPETDSYASESFVNESIFCVASVYGLLFY